MFCFFWEVFFPFDTRQESRASPAGHSIAFFPSNNISSCWHDVPKIYQGVVLDFTVGDPTRRTWVLGRACFFGIVEQTDMAQAALASLRWAHSCLQELHSYNKDLWLCRRCCIFIFVVSFLPSPVSYSIFCAVEIKPVSSLRLCAGTTTSCAPMHISYHSVYGACRRTRYGTNKKV